jgi:GNAT superfamily N-acetyltransferase
VERWYADGALPAPGVYGVPEQWPHVRALYERAGFVHGGHTEVVLLARVDQLPRPTQAPITGLELRRAVGVNGTRLSACLGEEVLGYIEVETNLGDGGRLGQLGGWADVGNLHVSEGCRRQGVATWLVVQAADSLRLARVERLLDTPGLRRRRRRRTAWRCCAGSASGSSRAPLGAGSSDPSRRPNPWGADGGS